VFYGRSKDGTWYFLSKNGRKDPNFYTLKELRNEYGPTKIEFWNPKK